MRVQKTALLKVSDLRDGMTFCRHGSACIKGADGVQYSLSTGLPLLMPFEYVDKADLSFNFPVFEGLKVGDAFVTSSDAYMKIDKDAAINLDTGQIVKFAPTDLVAPMDLEVVVS